MGQKDPKLPKQLFKSNRTLYIMLSDFRLCHKTTVMKSAWYWHKNKHIDQCNRKESLKINVFTYGQLICDKRS